MKILVIDFDKLHHKNRRGLIEMFTFIQRNINSELKYLIGNISHIQNNFDIVYSPCKPINTSLYPNKKFIFGPHFSVFPNKLLDSIKNVNNNSIYIQPSKWAANVWKNLNAEYCLPIKVLPFPVDINYFKPNSDTTKKNCVMIYYKRRNPSELGFIINFLNKNKIEHRVFDYIKRYDEKEYLEYLKKSKYGIIVDAHESQGFAILEALSCNVPLLVWNVTTMRQEYGSRYSFIDANTIPYWDERCGEYFYESKDFHKTYNKFMSKINDYKPREYIIEQMSAKPCSDYFNTLINTF